MLTSLKVSHSIRLRFHPD